MSAYRAFEIILIGVIVFSKKYKKTCQELFDLFYKFTKNLFPPSSSPQIDSKRRFVVNSYKQYYEQACSWADDRFGGIEASRNRYQFAFICAMTLCTVLTIALSIMMPLKQLEPLIIHHYANGVTTAERTTQNALTPTQAQIESDLVRYVIQRESYDITSYRAQFELVHLLSSNSVASEYDKVQRSSNKESPVNQLGTHLMRSVHVYSVNPIDQERFNDQEQKGRKRNHHDLAEVVFSIHDKNKTTGAETENHYTALISWRYTGIPASPEARWNNWNGFEVTRYSIQQRNVS